MIAVSLGDFWNEGPREALVGGAIGVSVTLTLTWVNRRLHKVREAVAREHHDELLEHHKAHAERLKAIREKVEA